MILNELVTLLSLHVGHWDNWGGTHRLYYLSPTAEEDVKSLVRQGYVKDDAGDNRPQLTTKGMSYCVLLRSGLDSIGQRAADEGEGEGEGEGKLRLRTTAALDGSPMLDDGAFFQVLNGSLASVARSGAQGDSACVARPAETVYSSEKAALDRAAALADRFVGATFFIMRAVRAVRREVAPEKTVKEL